MSVVWPTISTIIGWIYILAWSVSFYPQLILNYKRKSVTGLSLDFLILNVLGFLCYSTYTIVFLASTTVQDEYRRRNSKSAGPLVRGNDAAFAIHATLISTLTVIQFYFSGYDRTRDQVMSLAARVFLITSVVVVAALTLTAATGNNLQWIDVIYVLSYIKLLVSTIKFLPQLYLNYSRKSTVGWSIINILLDFTGGSLSLLQLFIDCALVDDWSAIKGNAVKTGLGFLAIFFDTLFVIQHYILYRHPSPTVNMDDDRSANESDPLLQA